MTVKTLDERVRERKDRYPVGFASRLNHILTWQRCEQAVIEEVLAESEADLKARGVQVATSSS